MPVSTEFPWRGGKWFRHQRQLRLACADGCRTGGNQHPGRHGAERDDQPEQAAAHHPQRGPVRLGPQHQAVAYGETGTS